MLITIEQNGGKNTLLSTTIELSKYFYYNLRFIEDESKEKKGDFMVEGKGNKRKKKLDISPTETDLFPIYKEDFGKQEKVYEMFDKMIDKFPFDVNSANQLLLDDVYIDFFHEDEENAKKKKEEEDGGGGGGFSRPEVDYPFEEDLIEKELPFQCSPLQIAGGKSNENYGELRFVLKICKENDPPEVQKRVMDQFTEYMKMIREAVEHKVFSVRIYVLNCSNLTSNGGGSPDSFVWIKRFDDDREMKDLNKIIEKSNNPEIMSVFTTKCIYPVIVL